MTIDSNDKVEPWLDGQLSVGVSHDLESVGAVTGTCVGGLGRWIRVKASNEAIQSAKHGGICLRRRCRLSRLREAQPAWILARFVGSTNTHCCSCQAMEHCKKPKALAHIADCFRPNF